jgi:hypothetical protein
VNHGHVVPGGARAGCAWAVLALRAQVEIFRRPTEAAHRGPARRSPFYTPLAPPSGRPATAEVPFSPRERACARPARRRSPPAPPAPCALGPGFLRALRAARGPCPRPCLSPPGILSGEERRLGASAFASGAPRPLHLGWRRGDPHL